MSISLLTTLNELLPPEQAMVVHALITARFHVIEKDGQTQDGLPVSIMVKVGKQHFAVQVGIGESEPFPNLPPLNSLDISE